jgi:hypothetical protein
MPRSTFILAVVISHLEYGGLLRPHLLCTNNYEEEAHLSTVLLFMSGIQPGNSVLNLELAAHINTKLPS